METFLESLWSQLEKCDGSMVWALSTSEDQLNLCRLTVERAVVGQIFVHAMYPNGEADISRDDVSIGAKSKRVMDLLELFQLHLSNGFMND